MDNEIKGEGNSLNYKFRMHDPRVGRFFATDPLAMQYPHYSPYSFGGNKVIENRELEGLEEYHYTLAFDDNDKPLLLLESRNDFVDVNSWVSFLHTLTFGLTDAPPINPYERHIVSDGETVDYFFDGGPYGAGFHSEKVQLTYNSRAKLIDGLNTIKEDLASRKKFIEKSVMIGQALSAVASEQQHYGTGARVKSGPRGSNNRSLLSRLRGVKSKNKVYREIKSKLLKATVIFKGREGFDGETMAIKNIVMHKKGAKSWADRSLVGKLKREIFQFKSKMLNEAREKGAKTLLLEFWRTPAGSTVRSRYMILEVDVKTGKTISSQEIKVSQHNKNNIKDGEKEN